MSAAPTPTQNKPQEQKDEKAQKDMPQLGALEEDDEFEEFAAEGK